MYDRNIDACQEEIAPVEPVPVYTVNPDRVTIPPKSSCQLEFFGFSAQPGQLEEHFICSLGTGVKVKQTVFDITVRCALLTFQKFMRHGLLINALGVCSFSKSCIPQPTYLHAELVNVTLSYASKQYLLAAVFIG